MKLSVGCLILCVGCMSLFVCPVTAEVIFEDDFMGDNNDGGVPANWQWWLFDQVWVVEADDVPEYGPGVMNLGGDTGSTIHMGLEVEEVKKLTDYRVTVLFTDRLIVGEQDDGDFHVGIRCNPDYDPEVDEPTGCYEVEYDGDDNGPRNEVPEDGPTSFFLFTRDGDAELRGEDEDFVAWATRDVVPRPVRNTWYWLSLQAVGNVISTKVWEYGTEEPDWILTKEDPYNEFPQGGVRIGVWSGVAEVAYVKVETVEEAPVVDWSLR